VFGRAGASLAEGGAWQKAAGANKGAAAAERATGELLDRLALAEDGPTVFHDLRLPGGEANIDHLIVAGRRVTVVDTKWWKPGWYWGKPPNMRRGATRFRAAESGATMAAVGAVNRLLAAHGVRAARSGAVWAVHQSNPAGKVRLRLARKPGVKLMTWRRFRGKAFAGRFAGNADPAVAAALAPLVDQPGRPPARKAPGGR
jgi:hypothetical protein